MYALHAENPDSIPITYGTIYVLGEATENLHIWLQTKIKENIVLIGMLVGKNY